MGVHDGAGVVTGRYVGGGRKTTDRWTGRFELCDRVDTDSYGAFYGRDFGAQALLACRFCVTRDSGRQPSHDRHDTGVSILKAVKNLASHDVPLAHTEASTQRATLV